jgi:hypothetical protein
MEDNIKIDFMETGWDSSRAVYRSAADGCENSVNSLVP